ncbi:hypothetical protein [Zavarzinia sp. CC-PAN008]|uniref:hypothetical protein n=1 Tax=Zavarzinia sp. CC-PAN008 TaxID=3243332 RepID=UPI003F7439E6
MVEVLAFPGPARRAVRRFVEHVAATPDCDTPCDSAMLLDSLGIEAEAILTDLGTDFDEGDTAMRITRDLAAIERPSLNVYAAEDMLTLIQVRARTLLARRHLKPVSRIAWVRDGST